MKKNIPDTHAFHTSEESLNTITETSKELIDSTRKNVDEAEEIAEKTVDKAEKTAQGIGAKTKQVFDNTVIKTKKTSHTNANRFTWLAAGFLCGIVVAFGLIFVGHSTSLMPKANEATTLDITTVQQIVEPASSLISTTYNYTDIIEYKNSKEIGGMEVPLTENHYLITYGGTIQLGIESLNDITYTIDNENKTITVDLPEIVIISNSLDQDSFKKYEIKNSILNETTMEETIDMEREFKDTQSNKVMNDEEVIQEAKDNLKTTISLFLTAADETSEYEVIFN